MKLLKRRSYHNYFDGYCERIEPKKNGKGTHIVRYYTGEFYREKITQEDWKRKRKVCIVSILAAMVCFLAASLTRTAANSHAALALCLCLDVLTLLWTLYGFVGFITSERDLKRHEYRDRDTFLQGSLTAGLCLTATAAVCLVVTCVLSDFRGIPDICSIAGYAASGLLLLHTNRREKRAVYETIRNATQVPEDVYDIRREKA